VEESHSLPTWPLASSTDFRILAGLASGDSAGDSRNISRFPAFGRSHRAWLVAIGINAWPDALRRSLADATAHAVTAPTRTTKVHNIGHLKLGMRRALIRRQNLNGIEIERSLL
jgi:hypothetical protein